MNKKELKELLKDTIKILDDKKEQLLNPKYSKIDEIPNGKASNKITEGCLVLEGGAFRGMYTQGALDYLMQKGINFKTVIGVSAGALTGINYVSGQIGRAARANLNFRNNDEFLGVKAFKKSGSIINLDFLFDDLNKYEPLDEKSIEKRGQRYIAVVTNCETGETNYFEKGKCENIYDAIKASASMPFISPMVKVEGVQCLDGGCSTSIPYEWAVKEGYEKIIIIRTRDKEYKSQGERFKPITNKLSELYSDYPKLKESLKNSTEKYNKEIEEIEELDKTGKAFVLYPSKEITIGRLEKNVEKLGEIYWLGYNDMKENFKDLQSYLNNDITRRINIKTVAISGNIKFKKQMEKISKDLLLKNNINVLQPVYDVGNYKKLSEEEIKNLKIGQFRRIELADAIYVLDIYGEIDEQTKKEIEFAKRKNKEIIYHSKYSKTGIFEKETNIFKKIFPNIFGN